MNVNLTHDGTIAFRLCTENDKNSIQSNTHNFDDNITDPDDNNKNYFPAFDLSTKN